MLNHTKEYKKEFRLPKLTHGEKEILLTGAGADNRNDDTRDPSSLQTPESLLIDSGDTIAVSKQPLKRINFIYLSAHEPRIRALLAFLKKAQGLKLPQAEKKKAFFLINTTRKYPALNGIVLFERNLVPPEKFRENLRLTPTSPSQEMCLWHCAFVSPFSHKDLKDMSRPTSIACLLFYEALYEKLVAIGQTYNIPYLWVVLSPQEALCLNALGAFPFLFKVNPQESADGLFHGLFALRDLLEVRSTLQDADNAVSADLALRQEEGL